MRVPRTTARAIEKAKIFPIILWNFLCCFLVNKIRKVPKQIHKITTQKCCIEKALKALFSSKKNSMNIKINETGKKVLRSTSERLSPTIY
jgi:hypothetical protein